MKERLYENEGKNWVGNGTVEVEDLNLAMTLCPLVSRELNF